VVFLDGAGHVHELFFTLVPVGLGQPGWQHTDLAQAADAPPAPPGRRCPVTTGRRPNSKQVSYIDAAVHAWELSAAPGAPWSAALAYMDDARHVHSMAAGANTGGFWWDLDLHKDANPPAPLAAGSALACSRGQGETPTRSLTSTTTATSTSCPRSAFTLSR